MKLHALMSLELDEQALEDLRADLLERGEVLYTEEPKTGRIVRHWPGTPDEWESMLDVQDLITAEVIVRSELLEVHDADVPVVSMRPSQRPMGWPEMLGAAVGSSLVTGAAVAAIMVEVLR